MNNPAYGIDTKKKKNKKAIPKALREQVWLHSIGPHFSSKCKIPWCENQMNVFDFQCGHNVPESKGGSTTIDNLIPICSRCNGSMGNHYTIEEWSNHFGPIVTASGRPTAKVAPLRQPVPGAVPDVPPPKGLRLLFCC